MNFEYTKKTQDLMNKVDDFMQKHQPEWHDLQTQLRC